MKIDMSVQMNEWGQPIGFSIKSRKPPSFPQGIVLEGRFSRLERFRSDHPIEELYEAFVRKQDESRWTYLPYGPFENFSDFQKWVHQFALEREPLFYLIFSNQTQKPLGLASYTRIDQENRVIEIGHLHFSEGLQQQTAATEAMFLMMAHVFELGYRRYEWKCDSLNLPSCRAAQRLGFSFEGVFRQARIYKGRNRDTAWFSIIDSEWTQLRRIYEIWLEPTNFDSNGFQKKSLSVLTKPLLKNSMS